VEALFGAAAGAVPCLMFGAFAVIATLIIVFSIWQARQRRRTMQLLARKLGLAFYPTDPWDRRRLRLPVHDRQREESAHA